MSRFRLSRKEAEEIRRELSGGRLLSVSPAIERELLELAAVGEDAYPFREGPP